jgi:hypothetical protein
MAPSADVVSTVYTYRPAMRVAGRTGDAAPFLQYHMSAFLVNKEDPMARPFSLYQHGCYVLLETRALQSASDKKWLFIVFPRMQDVAGGQGGILAGDHFSFVLDPSDKKHTHLHLHATLYQNWITDGTRIEGRRDQHNNYLPKRLMVPVEQLAFRDQVTL